MPIPQLRAWPREMLRRLQLRHEQPLGLTVTPDAELAWPWQRWQRWQRSGMRRLRCAVRVTSRYNVEAGTLWSPLAMLAAMVDAPLLVIRWQPQHQRQARPCHQSLRGVCEALRTPADVHLRCQPVTFALRFARHFPWIGDNSPFRTRRPTLRLL